MTPGAHRVPLGEAARTWARVGLQSFGGPAGQIAVMHKELVDDRAWVAEKRFLHALNFCMLLPGPEAMQLSVYLGWLLNGVRGGVVAGTLFVLPGLVFMMGIAAVYVEYGTVGPVADALVGLQAAVIAIVAQALLRIGRRALTTRLLVAVSAASFLAMLLLDAPFPLVVGVALVVGWVVGRRRPQALAVVQPKDADTDALAERSRRVVWRAAAAALALWWVPVGVLYQSLGPDNVLTQQAWLFSVVAMTSFGGAYAALAYVSQQAVGSYGWIEAKDVVAGLGLAETTPGPLVLVLPFIGFVGAYGMAAQLGVPPLLAGLAGGLVSAWVTFLPSFAFVFAGAPYVERLRHDRRAAGALAAVTGAVVGVIADLGLWFAGTVLFGEVVTKPWGPFRLPTVDVGDLRVVSLVIAVVAAVLLFRLRWGIPRVLVVCSAASLLLALPG
jgi:chromate transporter